LAHIAASSTAAGDVRMFSTNL